MFPTQRFLFWIWLLPAALWGADTDVLTNRLIITSNQVNALSRSDVRSGSTAIQMYYDATDGVIYASKLNGWNQDWALYIQAPSALGASGPLGAYGPLGSAGPLFNVSATAPAGFVASQYTYGTYAWGSSERYGADAFGASGPLGASGPITEASLYNTMYHLNENASCVDGLDGVCDWNDFPHALDPSGVWGVLGPLGPTGALGALGPLGILGFGHQTGVVYVDGNGSYTGFYKNGALTRRLDIPYNGGSVVRRYDLFEMYSRAFLQSAQLSPATFTNDTSFSVDARSFSPLTSTNDEYVFASNYDQYISIVVTPVNPHSDFDFKVFRKPLDSSFATNPLGNFPATASNSRPPIDRIPLTVRFSLSKLKGNMERAVSGRRPSIL